MKKCGRNEPCFIEGVHWGHFSRVLCEHLGERDGHSICLTTQEIVDVYSTENEYNAKGDNVMESYVTVVEDETGKGWCATINEFMDGERKITKSEPRYSHHAAVTEARAIALARNIQYVG